MQKSLKVAGPVGSVRELIGHVDGVWGVTAIEPVSQSTILDLNAHQVFPAASVIKVPILVELYRQATLGKLELSTPLRVTDSFRTAGSGILSRLSEQAMMTLKDLATLMMELSDNTAANVLIATLGREKINRTMAQMGLVQTTLWQDRIDLTTIQTPETLATTTPREIALLFVYLAQETILTPTACREILALMMRASNKRRICGQLPFRSDIFIYHKTGTLKGVYNDVGLVCLAGAQYVISVLTKGVTASTDPRTPNQAEQAIARLSRWVFDHLDQQQEGADHA